MATSFRATRDTLATLLRGYRRVRMMTQEALAERAGVSVGAISYLERGLTQSPHHDTLRALADALALSDEERRALDLASQRVPLEDISAPSTTATLQSGQIPQPLTRLIGREREMGDISEALQHVGVRLLTLTGPAGVGKTRLAIQVVTLAQEEFEREVIFIDLTPVHASAHVLPTIAEVLGVQQSVALPVRETIATALAGRDCILVLDNFEQVAAAGTAIAGLLAACPGVKALVTSRVALNVRGEQELPIAPLAVSDDLAITNLDEIEQIPSVALFIERVHAVRPDFALDVQADAQRLLEICARLDGLPLAIELAAAQMRHISLAELLRRLDSELPLNALSGGAQDLPDHQRAMRTTITWSYRLLTTEEKLVFRSLGVFVGGAEVEGLAAVTGLDQPALLARLDALVDHNLIYSSNDGASIRYAQLVTLRAYALERLRDAEELAIRREGHAAYYATLAERERLGIGRCEPASMALVAEEHENIRTALDWTLEAGDAQAIWTGLRLAGALWFWWEVRGFLVEGLEWLERLLPHAPIASRNKKAFVLANVWSGVMALSFRLSRMERAREAGERALDLRRRVGDKFALADALNNLGVVVSSMGQHQVAEAYYEDALAIYAEIGHPIEEFRPLLNLGVVKRDMRHHVEALALYRESLRLAERTTDHAETRAILWNNIGDVQILLGDLVEALKAVKRGEDLFRQLDSTWGLAMSGHDMGRIYFALGDFETAARQFSTAIAMRERIGDVAGAAQSRVRLALASIAQVHLADATTLLAEACQSLTRLGDSGALWAVGEGSAALACACGQFALAARLYAATIPRRDALWDVIDPSEHARRDQDLATIREMLSSEQYEQAVADAPSTLEGAQCLVADIIN
jgi:predicted ATPase/DNA-binding XRE family transcriptional regulator